MRLIDRNDLEFLRRNINAVIGATLELSQMGRLGCFVMVIYNKVWYGMVLCGMVWYGKLSCAVV